MYHDDYNALTFRNPPFNLIILMFMCCIGKGTKKCGLILEIILYFLNVLPWAIMFLIVLNVIYFPIAYIKMLNLAI